MSTKKKLAFLLVLALLASTTFYYGVASGADCVVSCNVPKAGTMTVPGTLSLNAVVDSTANTNLNITGIKTNCGWNITVYKQADLTSGALTIPSSQLKFTSTTQGTAIVFPTSAAPAIVRSSGTKSGEAGVSETVVYKLQLTYDDESATYSTTHTYTLNTP